MVQWLLDRGITSVGTLQTNQKGIPDEIKEIKDRETNSYEIYWEKDNGISNLHSYVVKTKSSGKQNVLLLSTVLLLLASTKANQQFRTCAGGFYLFIYFILFAIFILHSRESELYCYILDQYSQST